MAEAFAYIILNYIFNTILYKSHSTVYGIFSTVSENFVHIYARVKTQRRKSKPKQQQRHEKIMF